MSSAAQRSALYATAKIALGSLALASCAGRSTALEDSTSGGGAENGAPRSGGIAGGEMGGVSSAGRTGAGASSGGATGAAGTGGSAAAGVAGSAGNAAGSAGSGNELACVGPTVLTRMPIESAPTQAEFECCLAFVKDGVASNWGTPEGVTLLPSEPYANCCRAIIQGVEADGARYAAGDSVRKPCCSVGPQPEIWQYRACTPWGPPVPPAVNWGQA